VLIKGLSYIATENITSPASVGRGNHNSRTLHSANDSLVIKAELCDHCTDVCPSVCLTLCNSVSRITWTYVYGCRPNIVGVRKG